MVNEIDETRRIIRKDPIRASWMWSMALLARNVTYYRTTPRKKGAKIVAENGLVEFQFCSLKQRKLLGRRPSVLPAQGNALVVLHMLRTPAGLSRW